MKTVEAMTKTELWRRLRAHALVEGELPAAADGQTLWYVRVMLGVAGWIGALFLLGAVVLALGPILRDGADVLVGMLICVGAYLIFRIARFNDFGTQFALAASLAGQVPLVFGLVDNSTFDIASRYFVVCLLEIALALLMPNFIHRVLSSWAAMAALSFWLDRLGLHGIAPGIAAAGVAMLWLNELAWTGWDGLCRPIAYGLVLALLQITAMPLVGQLDWLLSSGGGNPWLYPRSAVLGASLVAAVLLVTVWRLLDREGQAPAGGVGIAAQAATIALALASYFAPGLGTAALVLLLGFAAGNRVLVGLGVFALGAYLSDYYYQLQQTLLLKSMVLALSGAVLLSARVALNRWLGPITSQAEVADA